MQAGTDLRRQTRRGEVVAMLAIAKIASERVYDEYKLSREGIDPTQLSDPSQRKITPEPGKTGGGKPPAELLVRRPQSRTAYILNSLKHPAEAELLREVYGPGFFLVGVHTSLEDRLIHLTKHLNIDPSEATRLIEIDQHEGDKFGQRTRDVYHRADVFVPFRQEEHSNRHLERFLDLVFGNPFSTPTRDEYAMFLAFASSVRSASLARQVGAVIVSSEGEVLGVGTNDVPRAHGGLYWPDQNDHRDHILGYDSNDVARKQMLEEIVPPIVVWARARKEAERFDFDQFLREIEGRIKELPDRSELVAQAALLLGDTSITDITEYGRAVHAEMEAILSCTRNGLSTRGATLYCTTFPCHNCAKHIVDAGICRVVYVQPYPKSRAEDLHGDAICFTGDDHDKVRFEPFDGVGPRRFFDLFSMNLGEGYDVERKEDGKIKRWARPLAKDPSIKDEPEIALPMRGPRVPMRPSSYLDREDLVARSLKKLEQERNK